MVNLESALKDVLSPVRTLLLWLQSQSASLSLPSQFLSLLRKSFPWVEDQKLAVQEQSQDTARTLFAEESVGAGDLEEARLDAAFVEMDRLAGEEKDQHPLPLEAQSFAEAAK